MCESSLDSGGVRGGVSRPDDCSVTVICRERDMEIVASAAISLINSGDRGIVVKTAKYGMSEPREKVTEVGKVIFR